ncbi:MAG: transcriptional regulator [Acidobacteria bacterium]|nr:MAG: transcriptional regulator [Acidobacteriota bacterium]
MELARSGMHGFSGARLRRYRQALDMTMADLADAAEVSEATVSAWETGRAAPTPPLLKRVADVLRVTVPDLAPIQEGRKDYDKDRVASMAKLYGVKFSVVKAVWERDRATRQEYIRRL